jgi:hypothetical protein
MTALMTERELRVLSKVWTRVVHQRPTIWRCKGHSEMRTLRNRFCLLEECPKDWHQEPDRLEHS